MNTLSAHYLYVEGNSASTEKFGSLRTDPDEFVRWLTCFPPKIRNGLWFFPVRFHPTDPKKAKAPDVPKGESWKDPKYRLSPGDAEHRLEVGGNVGVAPHGDIVATDVDNVRRADELNLIPNDLRDTLIVRTRDRRLHLYYINEGVTNAQYIEDRLKIVEIRAEWLYTLVPGSWVPPTPGSGGNGLYRVVNERIPLILRPEMLSWLNPKNDHTVYAPVNFEGAFANLPCIKALFQIKLPVGCRRRAGKFLSLAWLKDHESDAKGFIKFVEPFARFQDVGHIHKASEYNWISTIRSHKIEWSCGAMVNFLRRAGIYPPCDAECPLKMRGQNDGV